jgi:hypothetical protein
MHHFHIWTKAVLKIELTCPCRRELARTGQSQVASAPIGDLINAVGFTA